MNKEEIQKRFPAKVQITQEMIDEARIFNSRKCIGALALISVVPELDNDDALFAWGLYWGHISFSEDYLDNIRITSEEGVNMMLIKAPREVTLISPEILQS